MKALVLVAHPDDETIFAGGAMLSSPEMEWSIQCVTYSAESERGREFYAAVDGFRKAGVNIGLTEMLRQRDPEGGVIPASVYLQWEKAIRAHRVDADIVFTHNRLGDYGHPHHMAVNSIARSIYGGRVPMCEFFYPGLTGVGFQHGGHSRLRCQDTRKLDIFKAAYGHRLDGLMYHLPEMMNFLLIECDERHACVSS